MAPCARWAPWSALAWGPLLAALACSVYDNALPGDVAAPLGGSGTSAGVPGSEAVGGGTAGTSPGGAASGSGGAGSGGVVNGGKPSDTSNLAGGGTGGQSAGSAGSSGMASAGMGGEPALALEVIDDMEDNDAQIILKGGRNGFWYVGGDPTVGATTEPAVGAFKMAKLAAGDRSGFAARLKAVGFTSWGSVIGFNFVEMSGVKPYDASAYCGVQYWGKAAEPTTLRFRAPDGDTHPAGAVCVDGGAAAQACYDHFGTSAAFTTEWQSFTTKFPDLEQVGSGYHPADKKLKADKLYALEWALPGSGKTYEIWIDDVAFVKCK
jgi:hypothetical protein